jgi:hypothetical protein
MDDLQLSDPTPVATDPSIEPMDHDSFSGLSNPSFNDSGTTYIAPTNIAKMSKTDEITQSGLNILKGLDSGISSFIEGNANAVTAKFRSGEYMRNAQLQSIRTKELWNQESFDEQRMSERNAQQIGGEISAQAGQGINVRSEGAQSVTNATSEIGARDILTIRNNAYAKAFGYNMEAIQDQGEAKLQDIKAESEKSSGFYGALSGFASAGMKVAGAAS